MFNMLNLSYFLGKHTLFIQFSLFLGILWSDMHSSRHSIAHTKFEIRRDKRNALLEIAMAEKTQKLLKHIVLLKIMC